MAEVNASDAEVTDIRDGRPPALRTLMGCCVALAATPPRLLRPRRPDPAFLAGLTSHPAPVPRATVRLRAMPQSHTGAPLTIVAEGVRSLRTVHTGYCTFLVEHPRGRFLVDPGLCAHVHERVLPGQPFPLGLLTEPERPVRGLGEVLADVGTALDEIDFVLATHLHWDHVSGLLELPERVPLRIPAAEYEWARRGPHAPYGVVRATLRGRAVDHVELEGPPVLTFERSHDLFGDGSVVLVDLPGHTPGHLGVLLAVDEGRDRTATPTRVLLAGDAVWNSLQIKLIREKAPMPGMLFDADRDLTFRTIQRLHALPSDIEVIAAHDEAAAASRA